MTVLLDFGKFLIPKDRIIAVERDYVSDHRINVYVEGREKPLFIDYSSKNKRNDAYNGIKESFLGYTEVMV